MKKLEKAWIFIWAGAMLLFGLLTVNGLRFQYGDTVRTIVRGVDDLNLGSDLTGGLELALQPESGLPAEQQLLDNAREVLIKRLDYLGIQNAEVTVDSEESRLLVRFPNQPGVSQSDYPEIVSVLTSRNALTVRDGIASDEQGRPTGEILLEEKDIVSAQASGDRDTNTISVRLSLTEDGQSKFDAAAARLAEAGRRTAYGWLAQSGQLQKPWRVHREGPSVLYGIPGSRGHIGVPLPHPCGHPPGDRGGQPQPPALHDLQVVCGAEHDGPHHRRPLPGGPHQPQGAAGLCRGRSAAHQRSDQLRQGTGSAAPVPGGCL